MNKMALILFFLLRAVQASATCESAGIAQNSIDEATKIYQGTLIAFRSEARKLSDLYLTELYSEQADPKTFNYIRVAWEKSLAQTVKRYEMQAKKIAAANQDLTALRMNASIAARPLIIESINYEIKQFALDVLEVKQAIVEYQKYKAEDQILKQFSEIGAIAKVTVNFGLGSPHDSPIILEWKQKDNFMAVSAFRLAELIKHLNQRRLYLAL